MTFCRNTVRLLLTFMMVGLASNALAIDVGDPVSRSDTKGGFRVEGIFEHLDRKVDAMLDAREFVTSEGSIAIGDLNATQAVTANMALLRATFLGADALSVYVDLGVADPSGADSSPLVVGGGMRLMVYESSTARLVGFVNGHYVGTHELSLTSDVPQLGRRTITGDTDFYELGGGLLLTFSSYMSPRVRAIPYGGLNLSALRGELAADVAYPDLGVSDQQKVDLQEEARVGAVIGLSLVFDERFSARVEGRVFTESSISAGLGLTF